jgi:hypothetical protein
MGYLTGQRKSLSTYGSPRTPVGSTGPTGPSGGPVGPSGATGPTGPSSAASTGPTGPTGPTGLLGNIVPGATISNPSGGALNLSINGTGASPGYTAGGNQYTVLSLNENTSLTLLDGAGAIEGTPLIITRVDDSVYLLTISDEGSGSIWELPGSGSMVAYYNGTAWTFLLG